MKRTLSLIFAAFLAVAAFAQDEEGVRRLPLNHAFSESGSAVMLATTEDLSNPILRPIVWMLRNDPENGKNDIMFRAFDAQTDELITGADWKDDVTAYVKIDADGKKSYVVHDEKYTYLMMIPVPKFTDGKTYAIRLCPVLKK